MRRLSGLYFHALGSALGFSIVQILLYSVGSDQVSGVFSGVIEANRMSVVRFNRPRDVSC